MGHLVLPAEAPIDCIRDLISLVRSGEVDQKKRTAFEHGWNVVGYLGGVVLKDGDSGPIFGACPTEDCTDSELADKLEAFCDEQQRVSASASEERSMALSPLASILIPILLKWLFNRFGA